MKTLESGRSARRLSVGNSFTAADLYVGAQIGFGMMFGTIEKRPVSSNNWQRISTRAACVRAKQLDGGAWRTQQRRRPAERRHRLMHANTSARHAEVRRTDPARTCKGNTLTLWSHRADWG